MFPGRADGAVNAFLHDNILWFWLMVLLCQFIFSLNNVQAGKIRTLGFFKNVKLRGRQAKQYLGISRGKY